jgi:hypothetical protein
MRFDGTRNAKREPYVELFLNLFGYIAAVDSMDLGECHRKTAGSLATARINGVTH